MPAHLTTLHFPFFSSLPPVLPEDEDINDEEESREEEEVGQEMGEDWDDSDVEEVFPVQNAWANPWQRGTTG